MTSQIKALVLAAGKGTRLQTEGIDLPKVMRTVCGTPLLGYVLRALSFIPKEDTILVVGWKKESVLDAFAEYPYAVQEQLNGTGGAVQYAAPLFEHSNGHLLVCCGDTPLMQQSTLQALVQTHLRQNNACTMLSAHLPDPSGYGRIVREGGAFSRIVEQRDCTTAQAAIDEVNTGAYVFHIPALLGVLSQLTQNNAQSELYLTDVPALLLGRGERVGICDTCSPEEMLGVNTVQQLQQVETILTRGADV